MSNISLNIWGQWLIRSFNSKQNVLYPFSIFVSFLCFSFPVCWLDSPKNGLQKTGSVLLQGISSAHNSIIQGLDDVWEAGNTTLLGNSNYARRIVCCLILPIVLLSLRFWFVFISYPNLLGGVLLGLERKEKDQPPSDFDPEYVFVCASVGDCSK